MAPLLRCPTPKLAINKQTRKISCKGDRTCCLFKHCFKQCHQHVNMFIYARVLAEFLEYKNFQAILHFARLALWPPLPPSPPCPPPFPPPAALFPTPPCPKTYGVFQASLGAAAAAKYLDDRLCAPRDMGYLPARALRAACAKVAAKVAKAK